MLCQNCQKRIANVHVTKVINGEKFEMYLCEKCANESAYSNFGAPFDMSNFFSGLFGFENPVKYVTAATEETRCPMCGMSYSDFMHIGKMGCAKCYEVFGPRLQPVFRKLHGAQEHVGKYPRRMFAGKNASREIQRLKELLNQAIEREDYEKAAEIRDMIRKLEVE